MPKSSRWICRDCARVCVSRAALADTWCSCGHYQLANQIEIPRPRVHIEVDWSKAHVSLMGEGMMRAIKEGKARQAKAERLGHHDWRQNVDEDDVLDALWRSLRRRRDGEAR
jgi:hypothetical protein